MIFGIGVDLIKVERIARLLESNPRFFEKVFSATEREYCRNKANPAQSFAVRFAAKEAFMKALGTGWGQGISFKEIQVVNDDKGKPDIELSGTTWDYFRGHDLSRIYLSLSHEKDYAVAYVIVEADYDKSNPVHRETERG
nr:holo-[acyl-carrier protein] synthase [Candidatus Cloacimonadota bacterium]